MNDVLPELSKRKKTAVLILIIAAFALYGAAMLLCGFDVFKCRLDVIWLPGAFFTLAFCFLVAGLIGKNPVSLWLGAAVSILGVIGILAAYTDFGYDKLYPLYIAIPAIASIFTGIIRLNLKPHIRTIIFFGGLGGILCLQSFGLLLPVVVIPIAAAFIAATMVYVVIMIKKHSKE